MNNNTKLALWAALTLLVLGYATHRVCVYPWQDQETLSPPFARSDAATREQTPATLAPGRQPVVTVAAAEEPPAPAVVKDPAPDFPATEEAFVSWFLELGHPDKVQEAWATPGMKEAFEAIQEYRTVSYTVSTYGEREQARWQGYEPSVALYQELGARWDEHPHLLELFTTYSDETLNNIRAAGEHAGNLDVPASCWILVTELGKLPKYASATAFLDKLLQP